MSQSLFSQGTIAELSLSFSLSLSLSLSLSPSLSLSAYIAPLLQSPSFILLLYGILHNIGTRVCLKIGLNFLKFGLAMSTGLEVRSNWPWLPTLSSALSTN